VPGFELTDVRFEDTFTLLRYTRDEPIEVTPDELIAGHIDDSRRAAVLIER
jgi:hypothetical protein